MKLSNIKITAGGKLSGRTKQVLLYLLFVLISAFMWCFMTLNKDVQKDVTFNFEIVDVPKGVTLIDDLPPTVTITVRDQGTAFLRYELGPMPTIKVKFQDYLEKIDNKDYFRMSANQIRNAAKALLNTEATVTGVSPENIKLKYTTLPGRKLPIRWDLDIEPDFQYVQNGEIIHSQDSVTVYSDNETLAELNEVYTYHVTVHDLKQTLRREVTIAPIQGAKVVPRSVYVTIPIEQLMVKRETVKIQVRNQPEDVHIDLFPSVVNVSYLVPQSMYAQDNRVTAVVDFNAIDFRSKKVAVEVGEAPVRFQNVRLSLDSVEYFYEKLK